MPVDVNVMKRIKRWQAKRKAEQERIEGARARESIYRSVKENAGFNYKELKKLVRMGLVPEEHHAKVKEIFRTIEGRGFDWLTTRQMMDMDSLVRQIEGDLQAKKIKTGNYSGRKKGVVYRPLDE